jgi:uncharacterized repeat protein (TIGR03803 family)
MTAIARHRNWVSGMRLRTVRAAWVLAAMLGLVVIATQSAQAQRYRVLYSFAGRSDGFGPYAGLVRDAAGNFYGTTIWGGGIPENSGQGTVFKLDTSGTETVLHSFTDNPDEDGSQPYGSLIRDAAGNLYGTTYNSGASYGTIFKLDAGGNETVLHRFTGAPDGAGPFAGLVRDAAGNLYGTTLYGGAFTYGEVFKLDTSGNEIVLHSFNGTDGSGPSGGLILDAAGNLYGTTSNGGAYGGGTVFKLDTAGTETVLYSFKGGVHADGSQPVAVLVRDTARNLYGTTEWGGDLTCESYGCGTVFKVDPTGKETVLHTFTGGADGEQPWAGLVRDAAGNLYGTTQAGGGTGCQGGKGCGTIFKVDTSGTETVLYSFGARGENPTAALILDGKGNLYGTTFAGGAHGKGTVFKFTP